MLLSHSPTATSSENHAPSAYHRKKTKKNGATHGGERQKRTHGGRIKGRQTMDREKTRIRRTEERGQVEGKQDLNRTWVAAERMKLVALGRQRRLRLLAWENMQFASSRRHHSVLWINGWGIKPDTLTACWVTLQPFLRLMSSDLLFSKNKTNFRSKSAFWKRL